MSVKSRVSLSDPVVKSFVEKLVIREHCFMCSQPVEEEDKRMVLGIAEESWDRLRATSRGHADVVSVLEKNNFLLREKIELLQKANQLLEKHVRKLVTRLTGEKVAHSQTCVDALRMAVTSYGACEQLKPKVVRPKSA